MGATERRKLRDEMSLGERSVTYVTVRENDFVKTRELVRRRPSNGGVFDLDKFVKKLLVFPRLEPDPSTVLANEKK